MILLFFLFGLALGAVSPPDDRGLKLQRGNCPMFWFSFNGRCYKYISTRMTWADAELYCVSQGANLVSIHSDDEQTFVKQLISNFDHTLGWTWIGLSDTQKEGGWMWSDGCRAKFTFWDAGLPDNLQRNEGCVHMNNGRDKKWNDLSCLDRLPSVCASRIICP